VVVLETGGRAGNWNPHRHILMTSGGVTPQHRWLEVGYFPFEALHKKWQYHLFTMLKACVGTQEMKQQIDALWRKYRHGLVAYLEKGKVPAGGQGLAYSLAKYVVSPPDLASAYPVLRWAARALLVPRPQNGQASSGGATSTEVYRSHGATHSALRVSSYSLLWSACDLQASARAVVTENNLGSERSGDQGHVSGAGAADLPRAGVGQHGPGSASLPALWRPDDAVEGVAPALWSGL
jgi:Putative transposase